VGQYQTNAMDITSRYHAPDQRVPMTHKKNRQHGQRTATHLIEITSSKSRAAQLALTRSRSPIRVGQRILQRAVMGHSRSVMSAVARWLLRTRGVEVA